MAKKDRKTMLAGLMDAGPETGVAPRVPSPPAARRGAVGAISSVVADMRANAVLELDPETVRSGGLADRVETIEKDDVELKRSMQAHGQQVPILVRPDPENARAWQIVYGRRRLQAARELGVKVKALVRELDDEALVIAQGQENAARRDLSFIEKANFARQMVEAGYARTAICDALAIDKTLVSRMLSVAERLPEDLIRMIGAAHGIGRPRWLELAELLNDRMTSLDDLQVAIESNEGVDSVARFELVLMHLKGRVPKPKRKLTAVNSVELKAKDGTRIASARRIGRAGRLAIALDKTDGFDDWLLEQIPDLHAQWQSREK